MTAVSGDRPPTPAMEAAPGMPRDHGGPMFGAPWEAQAFAITLALEERGVLGWEEWAGALGEEIRLAQRAGDPDLGDTYFAHWLRALERLVAAKQLTSGETLAAYRDAWARAAERTTHGSPIDLRPDDFTP